jgi:Uma2 family endonuclease
MDEYIANGCRLAWLVDTYQKQTMVYRPDGSVLVVPFAQALDGGTVMPGLQLTMAEVLAD